MILTFLLFGSFIQLPTSHSITRLPLRPHTPTHNSALFVFFGALAGVGYVDPDAASAIPENEFVIGGPVFDASEGQLRELQLQEQREREQHWLKKQRPNSVSLVLSRARERARAHRITLQHCAATTSPSLTPLLVANYIQGAWMRKQREDGAVRVRPGETDDFGDDGQVIPAPK